VSDLKGLIVGAEAIILLVLGAADLLSGQFVGAAILIGIASLAAGCAWALLRAEDRIIGLAGARPRRAGRSQRRRR
jgi:uncharacterized MnhB-related membrane protein